MKHQCTHFIVKITKTNSLRIGRCQLKGVLSNQLLRIQHYRYWAVTCNSYLSTGIAKIEEGSLVQRWNRTQNAGLGFLLARFVLVSSLLENNKDLNHLLLLSKNWFGQLKVAELGLPGKKGLQHQDTTAWHYVGKTQFQTKTNSATEFSEVWFFITCTQCTCT